MAVSKLVLGMNARNFLFIRNSNRPRGKKIADDKLLSKEVFIKHAVPAPALIASFGTLQDVRDYAWKELPKSFALKPAAGYGGEGIMIVKKWDGARGVLSGGKPITQEELESHIFDILEGAYSFKNLPDRAFIEALVVSHSMFKKIGAQGVPDIRVIVWNKVPIMAMMRLPTTESEGKANLHLGAIGVGIDLRTGITTQAIYLNSVVRYVPNTKIKLRGIKIPDWDTVLHIAVSAQVASTLGYAGVDIVIDEREGPLVLEINARPGLSIQLANGASLRTRLERIADITVPSIEYGIDLAKRLFAEELLAEIETKSNILSVIEKVTVYGLRGKKTIEAKVDSGAFRTALDTALVDELGFRPSDQKIHIEAGVGSQVRHAAHITFKLRGKEIETVATYTDRSHLKYPMIIGRRDLEGFLIDPSKGPDES